uniref:Peptidase A1 n=1 Tax=Papaver somniferum TaxID=3469 RepID=A0A5B7LL41_PAPSO|nr:peptidase A1 [Papaver somniferum]
MKPDVARLSVDYETSRFYVAVVGLPMRLDLLHLVLLLKKCSLKDPTLAAVKRNTRFRNRRMVFYKSIRCCWRK